MEKLEKLQLLVVGVDGGSYELIQRMLGTGDLPNLQAISDRGAFGVLQSTFPPHTAPGWASMFTGVNPGEHGIYQFWEVQPGDYGSHAVNADNYGREPIWQILNRHGKRVGVYNVPMSHPPATLDDGYMISWPLSPTLRYTSPPELVSELAAANLHHHSDIVTMYRGQKDYLDQAANFIRGKAETCLYLQRTRPVEAMFVVFTEIDRISHHYWGEEEEPSQDVLAAYREMDDAIGQLMTLTDENTLLCVTSDHGFGLCRKDLNVNTFLETEGLLATTFREAGETLSQTRNDAEDASWFESAANYKKTIDWSQTEAYMPAPGCFGVNLNLKGRDKFGVVDGEEGKGKVEKRLKAAFQKLVDEDGDPLFEVVPRHEMYSGRKLSGAPDYLLVPKVWDIMPSPFLHSDLYSPPSQGAVHKPDGVLVARGPHIPSGTPVLARIEDIFPLILSHLGLPVPEPINGHWLFQPQEKVMREPAVLQESTSRMSDAEQKLMDIRLAEIGYL